MLVEALQRRGVEAIRDGEQVSVKLPVVRLDVHRVLSGEKSLKQEAAGFTLVRLTFKPSAALWNIELHSDSEVWTEHHKLILFAELNNAFSDCGYDTGTDRELVDKYYAGEADLATIFDELEELQQEKENLIQSGKYVEASAVLKKQDRLKVQIESLIQSCGSDE